MLVPTGEALVAETVMAEILMAEIPVAQIPIVESASFPVLGAISVSVLLALLLDGIFRELPRWHPLVGFGGFASKVENAFNRSSIKTLAGASAWLVTVIPLVLLAYGLSLLFPRETILGTLLSAVFLYFAIGWQSLIAHAKAISEPLGAGQISAARKSVGMIVSRDTSALNEQQIATAATESVLENGADAIFAAIFWFALFGIPGVVLYRLSNTLDAMWGYKNTRYRLFGMTAARVDDLLNLVPARLTALSYALVGNFQQAIGSWRKQAGTWKSPNAGPVMSAGAGAINVSLGGGAMYHGQWQERPPLGPETGEKASAKSIDRAVNLINRTLILWVIVIVLWEVLS